MNIRDMVRLNLDGQYAVDSLVMEHTCNKFNGLNVAPDGGLSWIKDETVGKVGINRHILVCVGTGDLPCMCDKCRKPFYHIGIGERDSREGWIASYSPETLAERNLTAEQIFDQELDTMIVFVAPLEYYYDALEIRKRKESMIEFLDAIPTGFFIDEKK